MSNLRDSHGHELRPLVLAMRQLLFSAGAILTGDHGLVVVRWSADNHVVDVHGTHRQLLLVCHETTLPESILLPGIHGPHRAIVLNRNLPADIVRVD